MEHVMRRMARASGYILAFGLPLTLCWSRHVSDIDLYERWAAAIWDGAVPYRQVPIEYPPLAVVLFVLPYLVGSHGGKYAALFRIGMGVLDMLQKWVLWRELKKMNSPYKGWFLAFYTLASVPLSMFYLKRFDMVAAVMTTLACVRLMNRPQSLGAWAALSCGVAVKLYPLVLMPLALFYSYQHRVPLRRLLGQVMVALGVGVGILGGAYALAGAHSWDWLVYHQERGLHVASSYAGLAFLIKGVGHPWPVETAFGSVQIEAPWAYRCAKLSVYLTGFLWVLTLLRVRAMGSFVTRPAGFWRAIAAVLTVTLLASKVLSPQYIIWILPAVAMAWALKPSQRIFFPLLFMAVVVLTGVVYPGELRMGQGHILKQMALILRTVGLAALWLSLLDGSDFSYENPKRCRVGLI